MIKLRVERRTPYQWWRDLVLRWRIAVTALTVVLGSLLITGGIGAYRYHQDAYWCKGFGSHGSVEQCIAHRRARGVACGLPG